MPEEGSAGGQAAEGSQGQGAQGTTQGSTSQGQEETFDKDRALSTIKAQREAEKALKAERDALKAKLAEHEQSQLSEHEKLQKRLSELESREAAWQTERQELVLRTAVVDAARGAGALHPDAVWKLVDLADVNFDDNGRPVNAVEVVAKARKEYPQLFGAAGSADGGARGGTAGGKVDMNAWLRGKSPLGA